MILMIDGNDSGLIGPGEPAQSLSKESEALSSERAAADSSREISGRGRGELLGVEGIMP